MEGLQSSQCGLKLTFKVVRLQSKYIQILHVGGNHWIAISNIDLHRDKGVADRVLIYDSLLSKNITLQTKQQVCALVRPTARSFRFDLMNIMPQPNTYDCGLFAIANIVELAFGHNPGKCVWDVDKMRHHLMSCFEKQKWDRFPVVKERRIPFGGAVKFSVAEDIHCICRMPYSKIVDMIECGACGIWFHHNCVTIENVTDYCNKKWHCDECKPLFG